MLLALAACGNDNGASTTGPDGSGAVDASDGAAGGDAAGSDTASIDASASDTAAVDVAEDGGATTPDGDANNDTQTDGSSPADADVAADASADSAKDSTPPSPQSCVGLCGDYNVDGQCACDDACVEFGDCCPDYVAACQCQSDADCDNSDPCAPEVCENGACMPESLLCDDNDDCTDDLCNPSSGKCEHVQSPDGTSCDGGVPCKDAACKAGKCIVGDDLGDGNYCDDGNPCLEDDSCVGGKCIGTTPADCDDFDACTSDSCDISSGGCVNKPLASGATCDDGNPCTEKDGCVAGNCSGVDLADGSACDDANPCTVGDACKSGQCETSDAPSGTPCDDGDLCTSKDACDFGQCQGDTTLCDDQQDCTEDVCDPKSGACSHKAVPDGFFCDDGEPCTEDDACNAATCTAGVAVLCDDGNSCTVDLCDGSGGTKDCVHNALANGDKCEDGDLCTVGDVCQAGSCVAKAGACQLVYSNDMPCNDPTWKFQNSGTAAATTWAVDGTPNPPQPKSGSCSLNFNNGLNYDDGFDIDAAGSATSAPIALPATGKVRLAFWQWHDVEASSKYDMRWVYVSADNFASTPVQVQLDNLAAGQQWTFHSLSLDGLQGKSVQVRFAFDSVDGANNEGAGWFVDDLKVEVLP